MHHRSASAARGNGGGEGQERSLINAQFIGSYPSADFRIDPSLPEIGFLGRSNVGKSTLINALTGRKTLARTSRTPGKTQMCNVYLVNNQYYLVDLPGYGYARASKAVRRDLRALLERYLKERRPLAGVVWLLDIRRDPTPDDLSMGSVLHERGLPTLVTITKGDKLPHGRRTARTRAIIEAVRVQEDQCVVTSARSGSGIGDLRKAIGEFVSAVA